MEADRSELIDEPGIMIPDFIGVHLLKTASFRSFQIVAALKLKLC